VFDAAAITGPTGFIQQTAQLLSEARVRDKARWNQPDYATTLTALTTWITNRLAWVDANLPRLGVYIQGAETSTEICAAPIQLKVYTAGTSSTSGPATVRRSAAPPRPSTPPAKPVPTPSRLPTKAARPGPCPPSR
jgi:hypothetical protein